MKKEGVGHGIAWARYKNFGAYCAVVAEVEGAADIRVRRVVVAVDVGEVVNPDGVANQMEGGAIQATSWTLKEAVRFDASRITSDTWETYPILRFSEVPAVDVEIVSRPDGEVPRRGRGGAWAHGGRHRQCHLRGPRRARARPAHHARAHHRRHGVSVGRERTGRGPNAGRGAERRSGAGARLCARSSVQGRDRLRHRRHVRCSRRHARQAVRWRACGPPDSHIRNHCRASLARAM